jgi:hypothetical protein
MTDRAKSAQMIIRQTGRRREREKCIRALFYFFIFSEIFTRSAIEELSKIINYIDDDD